LFRRLLRIVALLVVMMVRGIIGSIDAEGIWHERLV
jgi:hypothetical protein